MPDSVKAKSAEDKNHIGDYKWKCKSCGKIEYYSYSGVPSGSDKSCKKGKAGYHSWKRLGCIEKG